MKRRKCITMYVENKEGFITSHDYDDWDDILIYVSTYRPSCKITFEEIYEDVDDE